MDFFLSNVTLYFTPKTAGLSMGRPLPTIKDCMRLLWSNSYLSKFSHDGTVYFMNRENIQFWSTDYRNYLKGQMVV